jgi:hypothetical protein
MTAPFNFEEILFSANNQTAKERKITLVTPQIHY